MQNNLDDTVSVISSHNILVGVLCIKYQGKTQSLDIKNKRC